MYENCKCRSCGKYHTDAVRDPPLAREGDGWLPVIRQECDTCLKARAGTAALDAYLRWRAEVIR